MSQTYLSFHIDDDVELDEIDNLCMQRVHREHAQPKKHFQPNKQAKFQLAGEMLSAAVHNYQTQPRF